MPGWQNSKSIPRGYSRSRGKPARYKLRYFRRYVAMEVGGFHSSSTRYATSIPVAPLLRSLAISI